jgi:glycosyltransferase involved in cell wall biosynthesis
VRSDPALVTILMAVHNGAAHLPEQLDSLARQTGVNWQLIASDDASTDDSRAILQAFSQRHPVRVVSGPGKGFVRNFMSLLAMCDTGGAVALADQDDVWFPDKLSRAISRLSAEPAEVPALYCSRRLNWQPETDRRHPSRHYRRAPSFANALVENIAAGNTIVLNGAAARLARQTAAMAWNVPYHDWWLYLLMSGAGGRVIHDPVPGLLYRRHASNVLGPGEGLGGGLRVNLDVARGGFAARVDQNLAALNAVADYLTPQNRDRLAAFAEARQAGVIRRLHLMRRAGVYRQGLLAGLGFWGAVCLGRV